MTTTVLKRCYNCGNDERRLSARTKLAWCRCCHSRAGFEPVPLNEVSGRDQKMAAYLKWAEA